MTDQLPSAPGIAQTRRRSQAIRVLKSAAVSRRGALGLAIFGIVVVIAILGPFIAPHDPTEILGMPFAPPSDSLRLGGDSLGRDVLSRVLAGGWVLLLMAALATCIAVTVGVVVGMTAAYRGGWIDHFLMRTTDIGLAIPQIVFALLFVSILGPQLWLVVLVVAFTMAPSVARVIRGAALEVSERDFVKAVELMGVSPRLIIVREILPNLVSPIMVELGLRLTYACITIAALSFLGFGQPPPAPNWGIMISENRVGLASNALGVIVPAAIIAFFTVGANLFTDAVTRTLLRGDLASSNPDATTVDSGSVPTWRPTS